MSTIVFCVYFIFQSGKCCVPAVIVLDKHTGRAARDPGVVGPSDENGCWTGQWVHFDKREDLVKGER